MVMRIMDSSGQPRPVNVDDMYQAAQGFRQQYSGSQSGRVVNAAQAAAMQNLSGYGKSPDEMYKSMVSPAALVSPTEMYKTLNTGLGVGTQPGANYGLSSKGKYGGFFTTEQLKTAVGAEALNLRDTISSQLRALAEQRYNELDKLYSQAGNIVRVTSRMPYQPTGPGVDAANKFKSELARWYAENAKPSEQALLTAGQVETTPLSEYAQTIAVNRYGMNPNLAAGTFANLDSEMYQSQRDRQYMNAYGMPYEQVQDIIKQQEEGFKGSMPDYASQIEDLIGAPITQLQNATGLTADRMYNVISAAKPVSISVKDDQGEDITVSANGPAVIEQINKALYRNDSDAAIGIAEAIEAINPEFASLLYSFMARDTEIRKKIQDRLSYLPDVFTAP